MASNGKPQLLKNVFSLQSNGAATETLNASVRQDKARISSARVASPQPAAVTKITRAQPLNNNPSRSQNNPSPKRKAVHLDLWVNPIVKAELQRIAQREGVSVSKAGSAFLEQALQQKIDLQYGALLQPIIESAIQKEMRAISTRLAWLLVRVAFDAGQTRSLVTNILGRQSGMTEETLKTILAMSQRTAKGNITRRTPQINELIEAVEKWLVADNGNSQGDLYKKQ
jgi:hypothetical protein